MIVLSQAISGGFYGAMEWDFEGLPRHFWGPFHHVSLQGSWNPAVHRLGPPGLVPGGLDPRNSVGNGWELNGGVCIGKSRLY